MKGKIIIRCKGADELPLSSLLNLQGGLKKLTSKNKKKLKDLIIKYGFRAPFFVWKNEGAFYILDGHQRDVVLKELQQEGWELPEKFPVAYVEAENEGEAREVLLSINSQFGRITGTSLKKFFDEFKIDLSILDSLEMPDIDFSFLKADNETGELNFRKSSGQGGIRSKEELTKKGDLWLLGKHRLLCGDSLKEEDLKRLFFDNEKADVLYADPPYGVSYSDQETGRQRALMQDGAERLDNVLEGDKMTPEELERFNKTWLSKVILFLADNWSGYVFYSDSNCIELFLPLRELNIRRNPSIVWFKDIPTPSFFHYKLQHEPLVYIGPGSNVKPFGKWYSEKSDVTVWEIASIQSAASKDDQGRSWFNGGSEKLDLHPNQKPVALAERAICNSSKSGDIILDPFVGSGSSIIAAEITGRRCFAVEINKDYMETALRRWEEFTGEKAELKERKE